MSMHSEKVDFLFEATRANILHGLPPREAFEEALEETLDIYFNDELEQAKEDEYQKKLIEMSDRELRQACDVARARLHLSEKELSDRKTGNVGGTD